jgi:hypothetical protein
MIAIGVNADVDDGATSTADVGESVGHGVLRSIALSLEERLVQGSNST